MLFEGHWSGRGCGAFLVFVFAPWLFATCFVEEFYTRFLVCIDMPKIIEICMLVLEQVGPFF